MSLDERGWKNLLTEITNRNVVPIVGARAVTVKAAGGDRPLYEVIAPALAESLGLSNAASYKSTAQVAREFIQQKGDLTDLRPCLLDLLAQHNQPGEALTALASIEDFKLYVSSTPDDLLVTALQARRSFDLNEQLFAFSPTGSTKESTKQSRDRKELPCDIPGDGKAPLLYKILGDIESNDVALWEGDYIDYIYALIAHPHLTEGLRQRLQKSSLLLIGAPSEDWIVRFMMRIARGNSLHLHKQVKVKDYVAEQRKQFSEAMVFFYQHATRDMQIIDTEPTAFACELAERWHKKKSDEEEKPNGGEKPNESNHLDAYLERPSEQSPKDAVFISYAKEDKYDAARLGLALERAGVPVWIDKQRLEWGEDYERGLESAVMDCSYFISLISKHTEDNPERFFHKERGWAARRFVEGTVFYLPLLLEGVSERSVQNEPKQFSKIHLEHFSTDGLSAFVSKVKRYWEELKASGKRPRG